MMAQKSAMLFLLGAAAVWPETTQAFSRSLGENGVCLWWRQRSVTYQVNENCSLDVRLDYCFSAVQAAFNVWDNVSCSDMQLIFGGTTISQEVGFDQDHWNDNINLIVWRESIWNHDRRAIALTTTTYDTFSGEIVDADVEVNGVGYIFTTAESSGTIMDIQNMMAHEVGHVVGLDHSNDTNATMYYNAPSGEIKKRDLTQDDINGLCNVYPIEGETPDCNGQRPDEEAGCGCMLAGRGPGFGVFTWPVLLVLLFRYSFGLGNRKGRLGS